MPSVTARDRFERIMYTLAAASRPEGARLEELARQLDAPLGDIMDDLNEINAATGHEAANIQISVDYDKTGTLLRVPFPGLAGGMCRPVQLTPAETLCLALALRGAVLHGDAPNDKTEPDIARRDAFLQRAERHLAQSPPSREAPPGGGPQPSAGSFGNS